MQESAKKSAVKIIEEFRKNRLEKLIYELKSCLILNSMDVLVYKLKFLLNYDFFLLNLYLEKLHLIFLLIHIDDFVLQ